MAAPERRTRADVTARPIAGDRTPVRRGPSAVSEPALVAVGAGPTASVDLPPLALSVDLDELASDLTEVILHEVFRQLIDPEILRPALTRAMVEKLTCLADLMSTAVVLDELSVPAALAFAEEVGHHGLSEQTLERSYRVGIEALWSTWLNLVERHCQHSGDPVAGAVRASIPIFFGFVDRMMPVCLDAYHRALSERHQIREHRRRRLAEQILDGTLVSPGGDAERFLDYRFDQQHVAGVLDSGDRAEDRRLAGELKRAARAGDLFVLERDCAPTELWLGLRAPVTAVTRAALSARAASSGRHIAFGDAGSGIDGLRSAMSSAREVARIQAMLADDVPDVLWADDVRIEALALGNLDGARALVSGVLGTAIDRGLLSGRVRETLEAWLATGSYVGAAARLGVHEQTVRQRLRRLEEALGRSLHSRRTELHVALRLSTLALPHGSIAGSDSR